MAVDEQAKSNLIVVQGAGESEKESCPHSGGPAGDAKHARGCELHSVAVVGTLAVAYMVISSGLITFNKYLIHEDRFPYVICIGIAQMLGSAAFNILLFRVRPSLYPSLTLSKMRVDIDHRYILKVLLPIAICFATNLVLGNLAFMHSSVAFLQMMKQSNVVIVYMFSLVVGLEHFSLKQVVLLVFIVLATSLTVHGERAFSPTGFALQAASMVFESIKLTLQNYSLSAVGKKLDALTYVLLIAPLVAGLLIFLVGVQLLLHFTPFWSSLPEALMFPSMERVIEYRWFLLGNICFAFVLNITHAVFIQKSSAITFILSGITMKDVLIVVSGACILGELLSPLQVIGFAMQVVGILGWALLKTGPDLLHSCNVFQGDRDRNRQLEFTNSRSPYLSSSIKDADDSSEVLTV